MGEKAIEDLCGPGVSLRPAGVDSLASLDTGSLGAGDGKDRNKNGQEQRGAFSASPV